MATEAQDIGNTVFFDVSVEELKLIFEKQSFHQFSWFGGPLDLFDKLFTSRKTGISSVSLEGRKNIFGSNKLDISRGRSLWTFVHEALKDKILLLLLIAGGISLAVGIYQDIYNQTRHHWIEGTAICTAVGVIVSITAINDYRRDRQFQLLNSKKNERIIKVIRDGMSKVSPIDDVVVGDIVLLEPGDIIPADGVLVSEIEVKCDDAAITGESDTVPKLFEDGRIFLPSGSKIAEGTGEMVVVAVGSNSTNGQIVESMLVDKETTPLQHKLNVIAEIIATIGVAAGVLLFVINFIRLLVNYRRLQSAPSELMFQCLHIFIQSLSLLAVAVPEGLPLAIALVLAYSTTKMLEDKI